MLGLAKAQTTSSTFCAPGVTTRNVSNTEQALELSDALYCSGSAQFEVHWVGEVLLTQTIAVSNGNSIKVMGRGADEAVIDGGGAVRLFEVNKGSTLELNGVSLVGGWSSGKGGAVQLSDFSRLAAANCSFVGNVAGTPQTDYSSIPSSSWTSTFGEGDGGGFSFFFVYRVGRRSRLIILASPNQALLLLLLLLFLRAKFCFRPGHFPAPAFICTYSSGVAFSIGICPAEKYLGSSVLIKFYGRRRQKIA